MSNILYLKLFRGSNNIFAIFIWSFDKKILKSYKKNVEMN